MLTEFNRKIIFEQEIEVKLTETGLKQWSYFTNSISNGNVLVVDVLTFCRAFGGSDINLFVVDGCFRVKESKYEKRKRIIDNLE